MTRDYKNSRKPSRKPARKAGRKPMPGWIWMLWGLGVGLAVALWVYVNDRQPGQSVVAEQRPRPEVTTKTEPQEDETPSRRFDFYEMLPRFEVVIPEVETGTPTPGDAPVERPGSYVLQAGSFKKFQDADRMKAQLALLGVEAGIQRVTIDDKTWHRVRVGPLKDLDQVNRMRERMREAQIDVFVVRLGE